MTMLLVAALAGTLAAQPPAENRPEPFRGPDLEKIQLLLDLTGEQAAQWKSMQETFRADQKSKLEAWKQAREQEREAHHQALKSLLDAKQWEKFQALQPERPYGQGGRHPGKKFASPGKQNGPCPCCEGGNGNGRK